MPTILASHEEGGRGKKFSASLGYTMRHRQTDRQTENRNSFHYLWNVVDFKYGVIMMLWANKLSHAPSGVLQSEGLKQSPAQASPTKFSSPCTVFVRWLTWKQKRQMEQITKSSRDALADGSTDVMSYIPRVKKRKKPSRWLQMFTVSLDKINRLQSKQTGSSDPPGLMVSAFSG